MKKLICSLLIAIMTIISSSFVVFAENNSFEIDLEWEGVNYGKITCSDVIAEGRKMFYIDDWMGYGLFEDYELFPYDSPYYGTYYGVQDCDWSYLDVIHNSTCTVELLDFEGYAVLGLWTCKPYIDDVIGMDAVYDPNGYEEDPPIQLLKDGQATIWDGYNANEIAIKGGDSTSFVFGDNHTYDPVEEIDLYYSLNCDDSLYILQCSIFDNQDEHKVTYWVPAYIKNDRLGIVVEPEVSVLLNGKEISFDQPPIIVEERTLVPVRAIFEALGAAVDWVQETQTAVAYKDGKTVEIQIGNNIMKVDNEEIALDVPAQIVNERTLVPVRAISEAFDCHVDWDGDTSTVIIRK